MTDDQELYQAMHLYQYPTLSPRFASIGGAENFYHISFYIIPREEQPAKPKV